MVLKLFSLGIEKVLRNYGKCFLKIRGNPVSWQTALAPNMRFDLKTQFNQRPPKWTRRVSTGGHDL